MRKKNGFAVDLLDTYYLCSSIGDLKTGMLNYIVIPAKKLSTLSLGQALTGYSTHHTFIVFTPSV